MPRRHFTTRPPLDAVTLEVIDGILSYAFPNIENRVPQNEFPLLPKESTITWIFEEVLTQLNCRLPLPLPVCHLVPLRFSILAYA